jgi:hypothetical protein
MKKSSIAAMSIDRNAPAHEHPARRVTVSTNVLAG